jgi:hypothetical protein
MGSHTELHLHLHAESEHSQMNCELVILQICEITTHLLRVRKYQNLVNVNQEVH